LAEFIVGHHRLPPQDLSAEQGVLGGILVHGVKVLVNVSIILKSEDFYDQRHSLIYETMLILYEKGQPVDEITVTSRLRDLSQLEIVGGAVFLAELADIVLAPTYVEHYAQMVRDKARLRLFITAAHQAIDSVYSRQADSEIALEEAERIIFAATQRRFSSSYSAIGPVLKSALVIIENRFKKKSTVSGVPTGFKQLDQITYGLQPDDLIIIAGRPSMGKTAFALNMAGNIALSYKIPVAVFSLEMSKEQLGLRLLSSEARISGSKLRGGFLSQFQDWPVLTQAADRLFAAPIYIDDTPALTALELRAKTRRLKSKYDIGVIFIDYLQLMQGNGSKKFNTREQEISTISRSLKALAKELKVPIVALSQLNRRVEERSGDKRPMLSDLRESGAIEQDADVIAFIYRKKLYKKKDDPEEIDDNIAEIIISKQRNGPTGTIKLVFLDDFTKFEDLTLCDIED